MNIIADVVKQRLYSLSVVFVVIATFCVYAFAIDQEKPDSELGLAVTKRPVVTIEGKEPVKVAIGDVVRVMGLAHPVW